MNTEMIANDADRELLAKVQDVIDGAQRPMLVGREGAHIQLPEPLFHVLTTAARLLQSGQAVVLMSENEEFTTQAAANYLGMSRPHLIKLLESGAMPFHFVGTHRRVYLKDLQNYDRERGAERRAALDRLASEVVEAGLDQADYTGEE